MKSSYLLIPFLLLPAAGCGKRQQSPAEEARPFPAPVIVVGATATSATMPLTGVVHPVTEADIAAQIAAPVLQVTKREGDSVRAGEVLVKLSSPALHDGVSQAEAALLSAREQERASVAQASLAGDTLARYQQLRENHSVTPHELDQMRQQNAAAEAQSRAASAQTQVAEAALAQAQAGAGHTVLVAPFSGRVTRRLADPGAMAMPGQPLLHLESTGEMELDVPVSESQLAMVQMGRKLVVHLGDETETTAVVRQLVPSGDAASHTFTVKLLLPESRRLLAGMTGIVEFPLSVAAPELLIPASSLLQQGGLDGVMVVGPNERAALRYVMLGARTGKSVQVVSGLTPGERILQQADSNLAGRRIEPRP